MVPKYNEYWKFLAFLIITTTKTKICLCSPPVLQKESTQEDSMLTSSTQQTEVDDITISWMWKLSSESWNECTSMNLEDHEHNKQSRSGPTHKKTMKQRNKETTKRKNGFAKKARMAENLKSYEK